MFARILRLLKDNPQGLTPTRMAQELGLRHPAQLTAILRDMHWRNYVRKDRLQVRGQVVYTLCDRTEWVSDKQVQP
jgi:DNA-binding IclR family transcriptional regulator